MKPTHACRSVIRIITLACNLLLIAPQRPKIGKRTSSFRQRNYISLPHTAAFAKVENLGNVWCAVFFVEPLLSTGPVKALTLAALGDQKMRDKGGR